MTDLMPVLKAEAWVSAWCSVLEKTDRIMSGLRTTVTVSVTGQNGIPADIPAWSDGLNIHISSEEIVALLRGGDSVAAALRLKGLNYHELCHVLFSPRVGSTVMNKVHREAILNPDWMYAFNALEDQRIETWFTALYGASRRYFEAAVMQWILKNGTAESALLLYGRKYLSPKIRVRVGQAFVARFGSQLYDEFKTVIDSYLTLSLPGEDQKAIALLQRYVELVADLKKDNGILPPLVINDNGGDGKHGHQDTRPDVVRTGAVSSKQNKAARAAAMEVIEDAIDADAELEEELDADGAESGTQGGAGAGSADDADDDDDTTDEDGLPGESNGNKGAGNGVGNDQPVSPMEAMLDEAAEQIDDIANDAAIQEDIEKLLDAVKATFNNQEADLKNKAAVVSYEATPSASATLAVRRTHGVLSRIRAAAEPETLFRQTHGRLDARRIISRQAGDTELFRSYDSGREDETGVEAVVLMDISGSMSGRMTDASTALWVLKRSFDRLDIPTTVLLYNYASDTRVAYRPGERAGAIVPQFSATGGTDPTEALSQAARIFYRSRMANKVLISITDGEWQYQTDDTLASTMKAITKMNVASLLLGIDNAVANFGKHYHDNGYDMSTIHDLPKAATKLVSTLLLRAENA